MSEHSMVIPQNSKEKEQGPLAPEGMVPAVCYALVDMGTHPNLKYGGDQHRLWVGFEVPSVRITGEYEGKPYDRPLVISDQFRYTMSMYEKSNLYKDIVSWRGKKMSNEEAESFELGSLLGQSCTLQVYHQEGKNGLLYNKYMSILPASEQLEPENDLLFYYMANGTDLPEILATGSMSWLGKVIADSNEWAALGRAAELNKDQLPYTEAPAPEPTEENGEDSSLPF